MATESRNIEMDNNDIYEVLARSNMRSEPSLNGAWVMTIPQGAVVRCIGTDDGEFSEIVYEGVNGYIYSGCIQRLANSRPTAEEAVVPMESAGQADTIENEHTHSVIMGSALGLGGLTSASSGGQSADATHMNDIEVLVNANLRGAPSIESRKLDTVPEGTMVTFLDEGENGFTHISYQGQTGYIYTKLLELEEYMTSDSGIDSTVTTREMQTSGGRRSNHGIMLTGQSGILAARNEMSTVIPVEAEETMAVSDMVEVQTIVASAAQAEAAARAASMTTGGTAYETRSRANMRMAPSVEGDWITTLPVGADVISLGETAGGYTMVQYNGITGYVLEDVLVDKVDISRLGTEPVLFTVTAYCSCKICCGNYSPEVTGREARTATGTIPQQGRTIAVDPQVIPYGTSVHIDGMGDYIAEDCGGAVRQNHIDIYFDSHEAALMFGTRRLYVTINP